MSIYLVAVMVSGLFYIVTFLATNDLMLGVFPAGLALIYFAFVASPQLNLYKKKMQYFKLTNQFVNNFIISLSIQPVIDSAYKNALTSLNFDFKDKLEGTEELSSLEKLQYLGNYFIKCIYKFSSISSTKCLIYSIY